MATPEHERWMKAFDDDDTDAEEERILEEEATNG